jgi:hypothetical protein
MRWKLNRGWVEAVGDTGGKTAVDDKVDPAAVSVDACRSDGNGP